MSEKEIRIETSMGPIKGLEDEKCRKFLGVPFAHCGRFEYAKLADHWDGELDATDYGPSCPQFRAWHTHMEEPMRRFYYKEFREGQEYTYDDDCLNVNIYTPKEAKNAPVIIYFYGGGFDSGLNWEGPFEGSGYAERGIITVFANYRVGVLGYLTHEDIKKEYGREGNFGLDDQRSAILWVRDHIAEFGGDPDNITLMGQSAGAMSIQYLLLDPENEGLFKRVIMMSGGGRFPEFSLPKPAESTREYWLQYMEIAGCKTLDELKEASLDTIFDAVEEIRKVRSDNRYNTMPVVDGVRLKDDVRIMMRKPLEVDTILGYTNTDMFAPLLAWTGNRYGRRHGAYVYFFDLDAPGDDNGAFHSSDLRYAFGNLDKSWRDYSERDYEVSNEIMNSYANFARTGDPNGEGAPKWEKAVSQVIPGRTKVLHFAPEGTKYGRAPYVRLTRNYLTKGDPTA